MKSYRKLIYLAAISFIFAACNNEIETPEQPQTEPEVRETITVTAKHGNEPETRLGHTYNTDGNTISVVWTENDAFAFYKGGTREVLALLSGAEATSATFIGAEPIGEATNYTAVYPAHRAAVNLADVDLTLLGQRQEGNNNMGHIGEFNYMVAKEITDITQNIAFEHIVSVLRINFPIEAGFIPKTLTVSNEDNSELAVGYKLSSDEPYTYAKSLTITLDEVISEPTGIAYLVVFPTTITQTLNVNVSGTISDEPKAYKGTIAVGASGQSIVASKVYNVVTSSLTEVGGTSDAASVFDDAVAGGTGESWVTGTGVGDSEENPFLITNAAQLKYLVKEINTTPDAYEGKYFKLTTDIHVTAATWTPIGLGTGYQGVPLFKGHFDGGGHTISGKLIMPDSKYLGFFGRNNGGSISNLHVAADISVKRESGSGNLFAGAIIGYTNNSALISCTATGKMECNAVANGIAEGFYVGKIVGSIREATKINNCQATGSLTGGVDSNEKEYIRLVLGGIVGDALSTSDATAAITQCTNSGSVVCSTETSPDVTSYIGGIVGWNNSNCNMNSCYNMGAVSGGKHTGGIAGQNSNGATIHTSHNLSKSISGDADGEVGLLVGRNYYNSFSGYVYNCCTSVAVGKLKLIGAPSSSDSATDDLTTCSSGH
ncbi:hypothetical protein D0T50_12985 [Bacteroides sp. 214]|uniref:hypothetical protein n=1 Tax=Bacteroides sp. 214 TaxID=2302935 RepID=UPI0013D41ADB|nr:hypothetical protein [Bacteroides sp. 214]NDW13796.1 hypothetical protein [Bacteroides sp. 214]